jgi:hypothetical protein
LEGTQVWNSKKLNIKLFTALRSSQSLSCSFQLAIGAVSNAISTQDTTKLQEMMGKDFNLTFLCRFYKVMFCSIMKILINFSGVQLSQCFKNAFLSLSEKQHKINLVRNSGYFKEAVFSFFSCDHLYIFISGSRKNKHN